MIKRILGFDVSSTTIGYCTLELDEKTNNIIFVNCNFIKPIKKGSIIERIVDTRNKLQKIIESIEPDYIVIEDIIKFMKGNSTAQTIITLTTFNRMLCLLSYDYLGKSPKLFNVMSIRHGIKIDKILPKKEQIPELVSYHLGITFPYKYNKFGKIKNESYDMADAIAVALYYAFILSKKIKVKRNEFI
jgi:Holliday junction resolvasome RuvABC endonuclease subunit